MKIKDIEQDLSKGYATTWEEFRTSFNRSTGKFMKDGSKLNLQDTPDYPGNMGFNDGDVKSLKGMPKKCHGNLDLAHNPITTLEGCPEIVDGFFSATNTKLTSLKGFPKEVDGTVDISYCKSLTSLAGLPKKLTGTVDAHGCAITTLSDCTLEELERGTFVISKNKLTSLEGCPKAFAIRASDNNIHSLKNIHKIIPACQEIYLTGNRIKDSILGLLLIEGLRKVHLDDPRITEIINKRLPNTQGSKAVMEAQSELLDMGFDELAQI